MLNESIFAILAPLLGYANASVDRERGNLDIHTGLNREGEFALTVNVRKKSSGSSPKKIMYFLVSSYENDEGWCLSLYFNLRTICYYTLVITREHILGHSTDLIENSLY